MQRSWKDRKQLTNHLPTGDNQDNFGPATSARDTRMVALVQFLARRAAERDFAQLIEGSREDVRSERDREGSQ